VPAAAPVPDHHSAPGIEDPWLTDGPWLAEEPVPPPAWLADEPALADPWLGDEPEPVPPAWLADDPGLADDPEWADAGPVGPPEVLKAGRWDRTRGDGAGFAAGGVVDDLPPGHVLAGLAGDVWAAGLERLSDDELIGVLRAARRLASWAAAMELAAAGDLWRRRVAEEAAGDAGAACHADDEIAASLTLTARAADQVLGLAIALSRLPATRAALASGDIDLPRARVIADELTGLSDEHAAAVEAAVAGAAAGQTTGQLRNAARRAVLAVDPGAALKRKEEAQREARVERWDEPAGTAALVGRDLPPAEVLAADTNLTALAKQLKAAGVPGTMDILRAKIYLALLTGVPLSSLLATGPGGSADPNGADLGGAEPGGSAAPDESPVTASSAESAAAHGGFPAFGGLRAGGAVGSVNLTVPLATWLGLSEEPGHAAGYGPLDATGARALAEALAAQGGARWCLTFTGPDGRPVAHGCARAGPVVRRGRRARSGPGPRAGPAGPAAGRVSGTRDRLGTGSRAGPAPAAREHRTFTVTLLTGDGCDHAWEEPAYRPSAPLRHLVAMRHATCVFPGCRRPAAQCDADHTIAYESGGRTCLCNLAPLCRRHHQAKQTPGWTLEQASPGVLTWTTPSGRRYVVTPAGSLC
jgi:hypothetical protein